MNGKVIFKDAALQAAFGRDGYVVVPFLTEEDVEALRALYFHYFPVSPEGFHSSSFLDDFAVKKEMSERAAAIIRPRAEAVFGHARVLGSAFLAKTAGRRSEMPVHQDWTIVDEDEYVAVNIWTPLQDSTKVNGGLEVLPGSHDFVRVMRSPSLPFFWSGHEEDIKAAMVPLSVKAGEAVVINQAVLHYSPPNQTDQVRIAVTTGLVSGDARLQFAFQGEKGSGQVELFEIDPDFFLRFEDFHKAIYERPGEVKSLGHVPYAAPVVSRAAVLRFLGREVREAVGTGEKVGFWGKVKGALGL